MSVMRNWLENLTDLEFKDGSLGEFDGTKNKSKSYEVHSIQKRANSQPKFFVVRLNMLHRFLPSRCNIAADGSLTKK